MKILDLQSMSPAVQITKVMNRIYRFGMTTTSGGNISVLDAQGNICITPSAVDKGALSESDMVHIKSDGTVEDKHKPSSELPLHQSIYRSRPDIKAIIHAHPPALVAFSIVRQVPNTHLTPMIQQVCGEIGYAEYALPSSQDLADRVAAALKEPRCMAVLMENHGIVVGGRDLVDAYGRFEVLEWCARILINASHLGRPVFLREEQMDSFFRCTSRPISQSGVRDSSPEETALRQEIYRIVARACNQGLMIGFCGTVSARLGETDFLITPANVARWNLMPEDMVYIKDNTVEMGKTPSRAKWLHQQIYRMHPSINAIIMTQTPHLTAFAVTHTPLNVRTIPESWIFL